MLNFNKQKFYFYNKKTKLFGKKLINFDLINSTNSYACKFENKIANLKDKNNFIEKFNGTVIISETQSNSYGRNYKRWLSPSGGLWFTLILITNLNILDLENINILMAISIIEAINNNFNLDLKLKWPNDIYYEGKKLCGILSELNSIKNKKFLNIGVGLNVNNSFNETADDINNNDDDDNKKNIINKDLLNAISLIDILKLKNNKSNNEFINKEKLLSDILSCFEINYEKYLINKDMKNIFLKIKNQILI